MLIPNINNVHDGFIGVLVELVSLKIFKFNFIIYEKQKIELFH